LPEPSKRHFVEQVLGHFNLLCAAVPHDQGVERERVGAPARADHEAEVPLGPAEVGAAAEGPDECIVGGARRRRRGVAVHVREEAEHERRQREAGEVGEEGAEGAVEERAERRRGERVEAEHDGEGDVEEVAGRRGGAGDGGREAEWERDDERAGQGRREEGREVRERGVEAPVRRGEHGGEMRDERGGGLRGRRVRHGRCLGECQRPIAKCRVGDGRVSDSTSATTDGAAARRRRHCWGSFPLFFWREREGVGRLCVRFDAQTSSRKI
jgi:hypothetical protein